MLRSLIRTTCSLARADLSNLARSSGGKAIVVRQLEQPDHEEKLEESRADLKSKRYMIFGTADAQNLPADNQVCEFEGIRSIMRPLAGPLVSYLQSVRHLLQI